MILLDPQGLERYVLRGRGGIFYNQSDAKGENPLQLAIMAARDYPAYFAPVLLRVRQLHTDEMCAIVNRIPADWMNAQAKDFCCRMLETTVQKLKEVHL
jgi:hypothetical protein